MMKKGFIFILILSLLMMVGCSQKEYLKNFTADPSKTDEYDVTMKRDLLCLMMAYPEDITGVEEGEKDRVYILMKSGKKILYDDKEKKNEQQKLQNPDLQDMMEQIYPLAPSHCLMEKGYDPGRIRVYSLLKEVYGGSRNQIESNLKNLKIGYKYYPFNQNNKAREALKKAVGESLLLAQKKQKLYTFIVPPSGTFNYRLIAGTNRLSPHSFGTAIDLKRDKRDYWKWTCREEGEKRLKGYPREIVQIFEKNNFIWGGKWAHFDILHFEYRPELILKARCFSSRSDNNQIWYDGVNTGDISIKKYIQLIEKGLK
ncbi:MAG: M15 family metallopeptidase [Marinisporobacter sp.]|jgi:hypothetical protein|nr:M15 family metallopeptidase [Marinisporobacter sp.]